MKFGRVGVVLCCEFSEVSRGKKMIGSKVRIHFVFVHFSFERPLKLKIMVMHCTNNEINTATVSYT